MGSSLREVARLARREAERDGDRAQKAAGSWQQAEIRGERTED
jgi:hypothetical protein